MAEIPRIMAGVTNKQDRLAMLEVLVDDLTVEERRAVSTFLCRKNDPLHILPIEVVIQITTYLRFEDVWRYQSVSRQWRFILSTDEVLKSAVARWYTHSAEDSARSSGTTPPTAKAIHIQALRTGLPFTTRIIETPHKADRDIITSQVDQSLALKGHRIAYINQPSGGSPYVTVHDLISGEKSHHRTTAREDVCCIALTSTLIAYVNFQGKLYAQSLSDASLDPTQLRLPSSSYSAFTADGNFCAIAFEVSHDQYTVALYDHRQQYLKELAFPCPQLHGRDDHKVASPVAMLLNAKEETIDMFCVCMLEVEALRLHDVYLEHRRYSFAGDELHASHYHRPAIRSMKRQHHLLCADLHPTGDEGVYLFRASTMYACTKDFQHRLSFDIVLCFDYRKGQLEERYFTGEILVPRTVGKGYHCYEQPIDFVLWKDIHIRTHPRHLEFSTENADVQASLSLDEDRYETLEANYDPRNRRLPTSTGSYPPLDHSLFINDTFLVLVTKVFRAGTRNIHIYCFDPGLECEGFVDAGVR